MAEFARTDGADTQGSHTRGAATRAALLHASMLLSGFGTVFLGPTLPALAASVHATDKGSGLFFTAQFIGAFFGGMTTSSRLWFSLLRGALSAMAGFAALALLTAMHAGLLPAAAALLPLGYGVGQMLTSVNLLASQRAETGRGSALALINFSWSLGAVTAPFLLGTLLPSVSLPSLLGASAVLFAGIAAATVAQAGSSLWEDQGAARAGGKRRLPPAVFLYFAALLLIYGGVETSLSGWVTTFGTRYGGATLQSSALATTALWIGITAGRGLAPIFLRALPERVLLTSALAVAAGLVGMLIEAHGATAIITIAFLLGIALAPWFPLVLSAMLGEGAGAGEVGTIIAVSGLGAAALPLLTGAVSGYTGSLRIALMVPLAGLVLLLLLSFRRAKHPAAPAAI